MRFAPTLLVSSLASLLAPSVVAVHPVALTHTSPSRSLARLQHHEPRADLIDVCINIPNLVLDVLQLLDADIKLCVCLQDLNLYLSTIDDVKVQQQVAVAINATINGNDSLPRCALPPHAHRACTTADPCHIECDPGFTREGDQCVCAPPNVICSGQCGPPTAGCGASALARSLKSRHAPITTLARARAFCGSKAVCGVSDPKSDLDFECLDVATDFDSCGGCVTPHPFDEPESTRSHGIDCGRISNARQVSCQKNACVVRQCRHGFKISANASECLPVELVITHRNAHNGGGLRMRKEKSHRAPVITLGRPSSASSVVDLAGTIINLVLQVNLAGGNLGSSPSAATCGSLSGLIATINNLVQGVLGKPLLPLLVPGTVLGRDGILGGPILGGLLSELTGSLDAGSGALDVAGLDGISLSGLVDNLVAALNGTDSCGGVSDTLGGLGGTVQNLVSAVNALLAGLLTCGCSDDPAVTNGIAALLDQAAPNLASIVVPPAPVKHKRAFRSESRRGNLLDLSSGPITTAGNVVGVNLDSHSDASVLVPGLADPMATTIATTAAVTNMRDSIPSSAPSVFPLLASLATLFGSDPTTLSNNVNSAVDATKALQRSMSACGCTSSLNLNKLARYLNQLLASLLTMQSYCATNPPTVPGPASCLTVDASHVVCGLLPGVYIGPVVLCGLGSELNVPLQKLVDGLGLGAMPPATQCPASPASSALPPAGLDTTSPPPSTPSYSTTDVVNLVSNLLDLCFTINTGSSALSSGSSSDLVADTDNLLAYLLGPNPLRLESASDLGGTLGDILNGGNGALNLGGISGGGDDTAGLNHLVKSLLTALAAKAADPGCGCAGTVAGLVAAVNALGPAVAALSNAVSSCGCRGSPALLSGVSPLLHL